MALYSMIAACSGNQRSVDAGDAAPDGHATPADEDGGDALADDGGQPAMFSVQLEFDEPEFELDEAISGRVIVSNPHATPVVRRLRLDIDHTDGVCFDGTQASPCARVDLEPLSVPPGVTSYPFLRLAESSYPYFPHVRLPNDLRMLGTWEFRLTPSEGVAAQARFVAIAPRDVTIRIDAARTRGPVRLYQGVQNPSVTPFIDTTLLDALKINAWRGRVDDDDSAARYEFIRQHGDAAVESTLFVNAISEIDEPWTDWDAYDTALEQYLTSKLAGWDPAEFDCFDLANEPNNFFTGTRQQYFELLHHTLNVARDYARSRNGAFRFAGPSVSSSIWGSVGTGDENFWVELFAYFAENSLPLDVITWHEFSAPPEDLPGKVGWIRSLADAAGLCDAGCPRIDINEYHGPASHLVPGWAVGWLVYLDISDVDSAARACWTHDQAPELGVYWGCWRGFSGLLGPENDVPQPLYWVYWAQARMHEGVRLTSQSTSERCVALASRNDADQRLDILVGRYSCGQDGQWCGWPARECVPPGNGNLCPGEGPPGPPVDVELVIDHFPYTSPVHTLRVDILMVPNENVDEPLPTPVVTTRQLPASADPIVIDLTGYGDGAASYIVVTTCQDATCTK